MTDSKSLFDQNVISQALHAQKNVGVQLKVRNRRAENAARQKSNRDLNKTRREDGLKIERSPSGKRGQGGRGTGSTTYRNRGKLKRPQGSGGALQRWIDKLKGKGGSALGKMTPEGIAAAGEAASSVLNTLDMLTGGQDKILPGSGHTYSSGYNPEMYIGQGPGY